MGEKEVQLEDGTKIVFRPEARSDLKMVWEMFSTLSEDSLRFIPTRFTMERVESWIENLDYDQVLPILAVIRESSGRDRVVASAALLFSEDEAFKHNAEFGITVHDDYQNRGLGTILIQHMIDIARKKGLKKIYLIVSTENKRAIKVYERCGFKIEGRLVKEHYHYLTGEYGDDYRMFILL